MKKEHVHITPVKTYLAVAAALITMTGLTVAISFIDLGPFNITVALLIASVKALLVAFFFMHLFWDNKLYLILFASGLLFLTIFLTLTMFDTETRGSVDRETKGRINKESSIYQTPDPAGETAK
jgi:cytochrome c oxidase subunit 4